MEGYTPSVWGDLVPDKCAELYCSSPCFIGGYCCPSISLRPMKQACGGGQTGWEEDRQWFSCVESQTGCAFHAIVQQQNHQSSVKLRQEICRCQTCCLSHKLYLDCMFMIIWFVLLLYFCIGTLILTCLKWGSSHSPSSVTVQTQQHTHIQPAIPGSQQRDTAI